MNEFCYLMQCDSDFIIADSDEHFAVHGQTGTVRPVAAARLLNRLLELK